LFLASGGEGSGFAAIFLSSVDVGDRNEDGLVILGEADVSTVDAEALTAFLDRTGSFGRDGRPFLTSNDAPGRRNPWKRDSDTAAILDETRI
jgi:hypothetical protein